MRLNVTGEGEISAQARTYAEYRLFATLSQTVGTSLVQSAQLSLRTTEPSRRRDYVSCTVVVDVVGRDSLRVAVSAPHPYAAINRAIERLREVVWRSPETVATAK